MVWAAADTQHCSAGQYVGTFQASTVAISPAFYDTDRQCKLCCAGATCAGCFSHAELYVCPVRHANAALTLLFSCCATQSPRRRRSPAAALVLPDSAERALIKARLDGSKGAFAGTWIPLHTARDGCGWQGLDGTRAPRWFGCTRPCKIEHGASCAGRHSIAVRGLDRRLQGH